MFIGFPQSVIDPQNDDQVGNDLEKLLVPIGAERRERLQPLAGKAPVVVVALFSLSRDADLSLEFGIGHDDETPGLNVRPGWSGTGNLDAPLDKLDRDGFV